MPEVPRKRDVNLNEGVVRSIFDLMTPAELNLRNEVGVLFEIDTNENIVGAIFRIAFCTFE